MIRSMIRPSVVVERRAARFNSAREWVVRRSSPSPVRNRSTDAEHFPAEGPVLKSAPPLASPGGVDGFEKGDAGDRCDRCLDGWSPGETAAEARPPNGFQAGDSPAHPVFLQTASLAEQLERTRDQVVDGPRSPPTRAHQVGRFARSR